MFVNYYSLDILAFLFQNYFRNVSLSHDALDQGVLLPLSFPFHFSLVFPLILLSSIFFPPLSFFCLPFSLPSIFLPTFYFSRFPPFFSLFFVYLALFYFPLYPFSSFFFLSFLFFSLLPLFSFFPLLSFFFSHIPSLFSLSFSLAFFPFSRLSISFLLFFSPSLFLYPLTLFPLSFPFPTLFFFFLHFLSLLFSSFSLALSVCAGVCMCVRVVHLFIATIVMILILNNVE